jgi:hypothetical protein
VVLVVNSGCDTLVVILCFWYCFWYSTSGTASGAACELIVICDKSVTSDFKTACDCDSFLVSLLLFLPFSLVFFLCSRTYD